MFETATELPKAHEWRHEIGKGRTGAVGVALEKIVEVNAPESRGLSGGAATQDGHRRAPPRTDRVVERGSGIEHVVTRHRGVARASRRGKPERTCYRARVTKVPTASGSLRCRGRARALVGYVGFAGIRKDGRRLWRNVRDLGETSSIVFPGCHIWAGRNRFIRSRRCCQIIVRFRE